MLVVTATIEGQRVVIDGLEDDARRAPVALANGLRVCARGIFGEAHKLLTGPGRTPVRTQGKREWTATGYRNVNPTRPRGQFSFLGARPGSYPVPVITNNLREHLGILEPGESKRGDAGTFRAADNEFVVYDSASYARPIHEGEGTSRKHGRRPYMDDGLRNFDQAVGIVATVEKELDKEIDPS